MQYFHEMLYHVFPINQIFILIQLVAWNLYPASLWRVCDSSVYFDLRILFLFAPGICFRHVTVHFPRNIHTFCPVSSVFIHTTMQRRSLYT